MKEINIDILEVKNCLKSKNWNIHSLRNLENLCWTGFQCTLGPHIGHKWGRGGGGGHFTVKKTKTIGNTERGVSVALKDKSRTILHNSITPRSKTTLKKKIIYLAQDSRVNSQHKNMEPKEDFWVYLRHKNLTSLPHREFCVKHTKLPHTCRDTRLHK